MTAFRALKHTSPELTVNISLLESLGLVFKLFKVSLDRVGTESTPSCMYSTLVSNQFGWSGEVVAGRSVEGMMKELIGR
jgi:hypothetical protein